MTLVFLLYALFASVFTLSKTGLQYTEPFFFVGSRMLLAGVCLLGYQFVFQRNHCSFSKQHIWRILRLALFNIYFTNMFEFWGLRYLTSAKACFIYSLSPFASALLSYLIFSDKMSVKKWLGLFIGVAGMLPVLLSETSLEEGTGHFFIFSYAEIAVLAAALCSVYGWILLKQLVDDNGYSPILVNGLSMLIGGMAALTHSYFVETWDPLPISSYPPFLSCALALIIVSNLICYNLYGWLLKRFSATFMAFAGLSTPLFTALFGWLILDETIGASFFLSLSFVSVGLFFFYQEEMRKTKLAVDAQPLLDSDATIQVS